MKFWVSIYRTLYWSMVAVNAFTAGMAATIGLIVWATQGDGKMTLSKKGVSAVFDDEE